LLTLIFVNDLPEWVQNSIKMFADDTKIWVKIHRMEDKESLQHDLDNLIEWSKNGYLPLTQRNVK